MEAERAELQLEKAKRELRQKFGERKAGEGCVAVNAERCEVYKYEVFMRLFIFPSVLIDGGNFPNFGNFS